MTRMTHERANGIKTGYWSPETKEALVQQLAAYENTGLEPEDIKSTLAQTNDQLRVREGELKAAQAAVAWIRVSDGIDAIPERFLGYSKWRDVNEFRRRPNDLKWCVGGYVLGVDITHWMPLPPPPEEGRE